MMTSRVATLREVADKAGVHLATASRALSSDRSNLVSSETRARVRAAAESLGYRANALAQGLRRGTTGTLGIVVADLANPWIVPVLRGIEQVTRAAGRMPLIAESHDDPGILESTLDRLIENRVDGIVLAAARLEDERLVTELERRVPVVLAIRGYLDSDAGAAHYEVLQDDALGARMAVEHLARLGHRRIAQLTGPQGISSFRARGAGYTEAIAAHPGVSDVSIGGPALESTIVEGRRLAGDLLRLPPSERPTGIFAHNDLMALGAIDAIRDAGLRTPEDISVVGYNDAPLIDHVDPPLTTVRVPSHELGMHSARMLIALCEGEAPAQRRIMLAPSFVERRSTGTAPA